ncbi:MAG: hypothetical protein ACXWZS_08275 [Gemmatirosa sp.]
MRPNTDPRSSRAATTSTACADLACVETEPFPHARGGGGGAPDRELLLAGCADERIVLDGRSHAPLEIERVAAASHPAIRRGGVVAFTVPVGSRDALVVACEVQHRVRRGLRSADVAHAVRTSLGAELGMPGAHVVMLRPLALPLTAFGTARRRVTRKRFLDGWLEGVAWTAGREPRRRCDDVAEGGAHRAQPRAVAPRAD